MMNIIHTGLFSDRAFAIMTAAHNAIRRMPGRNYRKLQESTIARLPNNEVVIDCSHQYSPRAINKLANETEAKTWFARTMKAATKSSRISGEWSRDNISSNYALSNVQPSDIPDITVQDTYFIYDFLIERKRLNLKYVDEYINLMVGTERDDMATQLETERREQIKRLNEKWQPILRDADPNSYGTAHDEISDKVSAFRRKLTDEYMVKYNELKLQKQAEIDAINNQVAAALDPLNQFLSA